MSIYTFSLLQINEVEFLWSSIRPLLNAAVRTGHGEMEVDDILDHVRKELMFISVLRRRSKIVLAIAAEVLNYPRMRVLNVAYVGGSSGRIMAHHFYDQLERMGQIFNVAAVQCYCRPSVARLLRRYFPDVEETYVVMRKEVVPCA